MVFQLTKKNNYNLIIYSLIILFLTGFTFDKSWYTYESKPYGFKIEFPQKPAISCENKKTEIGNVKICNIVYDPTETNAKDENLTYLMNYTEYPTSKIDSNNKQQLALFYKNTIQLTVQGISGTLNKAQICDVEGHEGRNVIINLKDNVQMTMRIVLVGNKLYMAEVFTKSDKNLNESLKNFMKSFDLI